MTTDLAAPAQLMVLRVTRGRKVSEHLVATLNDASAWWCTYRDKHGSRSSTMPSVRIVVGGVPRAHVSFNGKVWEGLTYVAGATPLFNPYAEEN